MYNDNPEDDLLMENGVTAGSFKQFAESFNVEGSCPNIDVKDPCSAKEEAAALVF